MIAVPVPVVLLEGCELDLDEEISISENARLERSAGAAPVESSSAEGSSTLSVPKGQQLEHIADDDQPQGPIVEELYKPLESIAEDASLELMAAAGARRRQR